MFKMFKAQKYIAITPTLPARLPTDTARDIRDGDLADALMKYACQPPTVIGAVDPHILLNVVNAARKSKLNDGIVTHIWHTAPVNGAVPVYFLPEWLAEAAPVVQMSLDDLYASDAAAASYRMSIMVRRAQAGTVPLYPRPHIDIAVDEIGKLSQFVRQYIVSSGAGTRFYPVSLDREEAQELAAIAALPHDCYGYGGDEQYPALADFYEEKLGQNARAITAPAGVVVAVNSLLGHGAPSEPVVTDRGLTRIDFFAGPTDDEFAQLAAGTHPVTKWRGHLDLMTDLHRPEHHLDRLQARHRRNWGVFAPLTMEWSQRYGKMAAIPSVIQRHHLVRHPS